MSRFVVLISPPRERRELLDLERIAGYDIEIVPEGQEPRWSPPTLQVGAVVLAAVPFTPGADGTRYVAHVRSRSADGLVGESTALPLRLTCLGGAVVVRPSSPRIVSVAAVSGGLRVRWEYLDDQADVAVARFDLFADDGAGGAIDYVTPVATAGPYDRAAVITSLTAGLVYRVAVRAIGVNGQTDGGLGAAQGIPRAEPPYPYLDLAAEQVEA